MRPDEVRSIIDELTYKPGWIFKHFTYSDHWVTLVASSGMIPCAEHDGHQILFEGRITLNPGMIDREGFLNLLRDFMEKIEAHESHEWLKLHGIPITKDEHPFEFQVKYEIPENPPEETKKRSWTFGNRLKVWRDKALTI